MKELSLQNSRLDRRYDIRDVLGRGSYAEIFVARDTLASPHSPHSLVAIKALNVFLRDDLDPELERTLVENFQNEAVALDRVRHPNIISRLGHGTARDLRGTVFHYIVLEYMAGGDLQRLCRTRELTFKAAIRYLEQVCSGLRHAHRNGVIHRDIKPQNLLLTGDRETVKIADFGVARIHQADSPITRVGTNIYAPPEHSPLTAPGGMHRNGLSLTPAADIYSLAKSFYTLATGEAPRGFANRPITELPDTCGDAGWAGDLLPVLRKATADDPAERYQNVDEFWMALEPVRTLAYRSETATLVRPAGLAIPQAAVIPDFSPMAPAAPAFDTTSDLKLRLPFGPPAAVELELASPQPTASTGAAPPATPFDGILAGFQPAAPTRVRRGMRRLAVFAVVMLIFAGVLYASIYFGRTRILPGISDSFRARTGRANTDINLRPGPSTDNEPIGVVTKNSRVRIVKSENNWYQVDVIEQGRPRTSPLTATRGWLNGRYVDLDQ